jgi:POT family proton-dependent oligopeptide transporter
VFLLKGKYRNLFKNFVSFYSKYCQFFNLPVWSLAHISPLISFVILIFVSRGLSSPSNLAGSVSNSLVSPYWLISTYFILTIAELSLCAIGISFVSQIAPPNYKGLAQGGWLGATALGNLMAGIIGRFWDTIELWQFFLILVVMCVLSAIFIFSVLRLLENATKD